MISKIYKNNKEVKESTFVVREHGDKQAYFIGGGLGSMAGAAYLIRDCGFKGENIHILEGGEILGGSKDGEEGAENRFVYHGGIMLNERTYENFWELFSTIPSIENENISVKDEILNFNRNNPIHAKARIIDKSGEIQDVKSMLLSKVEAWTLFKLVAMTSEGELDNITIEQCFKDSPHFFETNFWYIWQSTFGFQKWSSAFELKRNIIRMMKEIPRIKTLEGMVNTPYNKYDSIILPIKKYLEKANVNLIKCRVTDLNYKNEEGITITRIHYDYDGEKRKFELQSGDICIMTNGCTTDCATLGNLRRSAKYRPVNPISADLWKTVTSEKADLGNPEPFFGNSDKTNWGMFTIICKDDELLKMIENSSGNIRGSGSLMTFKDSNWLITVVVPAQPYFKNQNEGTTILWGYALCTEKEGNFVNKPMRDCTGGEILRELIYHLHLEFSEKIIKESIIDVIPCVMPYIGSQLQPREKTDRPEVVPKGSTNFAMIGQFVDTPRDIVFSEEYSVRTARIAVYKLLGISKEICPITPENFRESVEIIREFIGFIFH